MTAELTERFYGPGDPRFEVRPCDGAARITVSHGPIGEVYAVRLRPVTGPPLGWLQLPPGAVTVKGATVHIAPGRLTWPAGRYGYEAAVVYRPAPAEPAGGGM